MAKLTTTNSFNFTDENNLFKSTHKDLVTRRAAVHKFRTKYWGSDFFEFRGKLNHLLAGSKSAKWPI